MPKILAEDGFAILAEDGFAILDEETSSTPVEPSVSASVASMPFGAPRPFGSAVSFGCRRLLTIDAGPQPSPFAAIRLPSNEPAVYAAVRLR